MLRANEAITYALTSLSFADSSACDGLAACLDAKRAMGGQKLGRKCALLRDGGAE